MAGWIGAGVGGAAVVLALGGAIAAAGWLDAPRVPAPAREPVPQAAVGRPPAVNAAPPAADQRFVVRHVLDIPGPIRIGDYRWDESGAPAGPVVVTVDIAAGTLSIFRAGYEIGTAAILYGADEKPTPTGVFPVLMKDAHHVSRQYNDAPMPYTLRLTADGVSIHGSDMGPGRATHGCIGVPVPFARRLFGAVEVGDRVIVTNGATLRPGDPLG